MYIYLFVGRRKDPQCPLHNIYTPTNSGRPQKVGGGPSYVSVFWYKCSATIGQQIRSRDKCELFNCEPRAYQKRPRRHIWWEANRLPLIRLVRVQFPVTIQTTHCLFFFRNIVITHSHTRIQGGAIESSATPLFFKISIFFIYVTWKLMCFTQKNKPKGRISKECRWNNFLNALFL